MKKIIVILTSLLFFASCDLEEQNENPNVPDRVPLSTLLPPAQKGLADITGGRVFRYSNIFAQQMRGIEGQDALVEVYNPDELFLGNVWSDIYVNSMINLRFIIDQAADESSPHYAGVARVQMALALNILTDFWGDVPYTEALLGSDFPNPSYDSQEDLYNIMFDLLDRAIVDLNAENSVFSPGADDIFYNGDLSRWINAARVLEARLHLRLTKRDPNAATAAAEALNLGSFSSDSEELLYPYLGTGEDRNPIFAFYENTPQSLVDTAFIALVEERADPRIDFLFRTIPFTGGNRKPGDYYSSNNSPIRLISFVEQLFLRTEIALRNGDGQAATLLEEAITYSMDELSDGEITAQQISDYISQNATLSGNFEADLEIVMTEKYIALFTTIETWADYRRTGYPELEPNEGGTTVSNPNGEIPRRLIYPQSERLRNTNFPQPAPNMQDRFWWDQ
jgi:hypothetical protein